MANIDKEIKALEHKFEKSLNEELLSALADLGCLMKKTELRYFLLDFFSTDYPFINYIKEITDDLYESRVEDLPEAWMDLVGCVIKKSEAFHQKFKEGNVENANEAKAAQEMSLKICPSELLSDLKTQYEALQKEYKPEDRKNVIANFIEVIIKNLLNLLNPIYDRYLKDFNFQMKFIAEIKRPFFIQNRYTRCSLFDQRARNHTSFLIRDGKDSDKSAIWRQADVSTMESMIIDKMSKSVVDTSTHTNSSFIEQ